MTHYENNQLRLVYENYSVSFASFMGRDLGKKLRGLIQRYDVAKLDEISEKVFDEVADLESKNYKLYIGLTNYYFENIWSMCKKDILNGKTAIALSKYRSCLDMVISYEKSKNCRFHKGTPYFFLGHCYLVNGNLDLAFQMIHNGHMENKIVYPELGKNYRKAPSYFFMSLDPDPNNYLLDYVLLMKGKIDYFIVEHNKISDIGTTFQRFESKFLRRTNDTFDDVKFFFVYLIMNFINMKLPGDEIMNYNYFSNIRKIELIFDLCIIIDRTLFEKFKNRFISGKVSALLHDLYNTPERSQKLKERLSHSEGEIISFEEDAPETVTKALLEDKICCNGKPIDYRFTCMLLAWRLRNFSAHNLGGMDQILNTAYTKVLVMLFSALFFATDALNSNDDSD